jgi:hypothetical protein
MEVKMNFWHQAWNWNATSDEEKGLFPCDRYMTSEYRSLIRAIDVSAPADTVFRWICQLKIAPYSYDWLDHGWRQSPRQLTPGLEQLELGQNFMIGRIVEFEQNCQITCLIQPELESKLGQTALTYLVKNIPPSASRIVVRINIGAQNWLERFRRFLLAWGDLIMMRKQLMTIKALAERNSPHD